MNPDYQKTKLKELSKFEINKLEDFILQNYKHSSKSHTAYALKQMLTRKMEIYIYEQDMFILMTELGFKGYVTASGKHYVYATN